MRGPLHCGVMVCMSCGMRRLTDVLLYPISVRLLPCLIDLKPLGVRSVELVTARLSTGSHVGHEGADSVRPLQIGKMIYNERWRTLRTLWLAPPNHWMVKLLPGLAGAVTSATCALRPQNMSGFDAPLTGSISATRRIGLGPVHFVRMPVRPSDYLHAPSSLPGSLPSYATPSMTT